MQQRFPAGFKLCIQLYLASGVLSSQCLSWSPSQFRCTRCTAETDEKVIGFAGISSCFTWLNQEPGLVQISSDCSLVSFGSDLYFVFSVFMHIGFRQILGAYFRSGSKFCTHEDLLWMTVPVLYCMYVLWPVIVNMTFFDANLLTVSDNCVFYC